jgi:hypothetical protein
MERLISKLNRPPVRFNRDGFLKALNKNSKEAIIAMRDSPELKKAVIVDVLQRFHKIIKSAKFPDDVSLVPNGFFLYGGQVIQEIFQQTKKIVDPKIGAAMMMTPSSDYDGQIILKFKEDGKISAKENISKETKLKAFLKKAMIKAAQPYGALFKVSVRTKLPHVIDVSLQDAKTGFDYAEFHAVNGYMGDRTGNEYTERGSDRLAQTKCCIETLKSLGLPVLNVKSLLYDQLFALDSMLTGNSHRKAVRPDKCQQRFVRMTFLYDLLKKTKKPVPKDVQMLVKEIVERMDKPKYAKYFKQCSVKIH